MIEIRFHGRGGQGSVIASEILATAFFKESKYVQAFPTFGVERRGAPVAAFLRVSMSPIRLRCQIEEPDHVIVLDSTLLSAIEVTAGLKKDGSILINSERGADFFEDFLNNGWRVGTIDASSIAAENHLGSRTNPIVNTAILGAFAGLTGLVGLESILQSISERVPIRPVNNVEAARVAFDSVQRAGLMEVSS